MSATPPRVLTVAGSDSGGGAGIQADLKTMLAFGVHGMSVLTAVTAQNSVGVQASWELPAEAVVAQLDSVLDDIGVDAVKTGMLASPGLVAAVAGRLAGVSAPIVVDPVGVSKHGDPLLAPDAVAVVRDALLPLATVVTPNLPEVALLAGVTVDDEAGLTRAADAVLALGPRWVLVKGGHLPGPPVDLLTDGSQRLWLRGERLDRSHTHGTGCTLASAVASALAMGRTVPEAAGLAKRWVAGAIRAGFPLGAGIGPVDHGWRWRAGERGPVVFRPGRLDREPAAGLVARQVRELADRYGGPGDPRDAPDPDDFRAPDGEFLVAWADGDPVGCGGVRLDADRVAEIKRMYVEPAARGRGIGRTLLAALEQAARDLGARTARLETGDAQPEAVCLYESAGYRRIPGYGVYRCSPRSVCYGRSLAGPG